MYLSPSQVHFTSVIDDLGASKMAADSHITEFYREMKMHRLYPRLQVVKKCGHYFTLDNTKLYMLRRMEEEGHCKIVPVDQVVLKKVPEAVQQMMIPPEDEAATPPRPEPKRFQSRRSSEQTLYRFPKKQLYHRDTKSVTCSLETGRRVLPLTNLAPDDVSSDSSCDEAWPDETESLIQPC